MLAYEPSPFDPAPIPFDKLSLDERLLSGIRDLGWAETRPVQSGVIPLALGGGDVIACAETGTGKTAAFLVPILQRFLNEPPPQPPRTRALVLAPTRELAVQIEDQVQGLTYHTTISSVAVFGGVPMDTQERALRAGVDIVVATPGRLMDHMRHDSIDFSGLEILVLDEADRMLDMGFWPDVQRILSALPAKRQTLLFSATMPGGSVEADAGVPARTEVRAGGTPRRSGPDDFARVQTVAAGEKTQWLARWLREEATGPVLVFCRTKIGAERLAGRLSGMGIRAAALHADRTQQQRMAAVEGFRTGTYPVLVATDVAARGLDIEGIAHVVNYRSAGHARGVRASRRPDGPGRINRQRVDAGRPRRSSRAARAGESRWRSTSITTRWARRATIPRRRHAGRATRSGTEPDAARRQPQSTAFVRFTSCRWQQPAEDGTRGVLHAPRGQALRGHDRVRSPTRGVRTASTTSCAARRRSGTRTRLPLLSSVRKLLRQVHPFPVRRQLLVRLPVQSRLLRLPVLLQRHRQIEMRVGVGRIQPQRIAVTDARLGVAAEIVEDVSQVEVRFEDVGLERDGALVAVPAPRRSRCVSSGCWRG